VSVRAQLIPVILQFHTLGVSFDPNTGAIATTSGSRTSDPTMPDSACFAGPVNVPRDVMLQSPIFKNADFNFGGHRCWRHEVCGCVPARELLEPDRPKQLSHYPEAGNARPLGDRRAR
jgi:hypothetical protein